uniref:Calcyphosin isoform X1 n=1 Tax=Pogona vitticeps TaxID=103695 RepID=A0A6J0SK02_9SAUR
MGGNLSLLDRGTPPGRVADVFFPRGPGQRLLPRRCQLPPGDRCHVLAEFFPPCRERHCYGDRVGTTPAKPGSQSGTAEAWRTPRKKATTGSRKEASKRLKGPDPKSLFLWQALLRRERKVLRMETGRRALDKLRAKCLERGASGIMGLARFFRNMDDNRSKTLDLEEFRKGLQEAGVPLEQGDMEEVFSLCDKNKSGMLDFDEFLEALRPPMSKARKDVIGDAFQKLDRTGDGLVTVEDLRGVYHCHGHPKFKSGEWTEDQVFRAFLDNFDSPGDKDGKITAEEFLNYYSGVSASIDSDEYFVDMIKSAWKL